MQPWHVEPQGRFQQHTVVSRALEGNPLGDPHERPVWVYLPPGVGDDPARRYPSVYVIQGYTGQRHLRITETSSLITNGVTWSW